MRDICTGGFLRNYQNDFLKEMQKFELQPIREVHPGHVVLFKELQEIKQMLKDKGSYRCPLKGKQSSGNIIELYRIPPSSISNNELYDSIIEELKNLSNNKIVDEIVLCDPFFVANLSEEQREADSVSFIQKLETSFNPSKIIIVSQVDLVKRLKVSNALFSKLYNSTRDYWHDRNIFLKTNQDEFLGLCIGYSIAQLSGDRGFTTGVMKSSDVNELFYILGGDARKL